VFCLNIFVFFFSFLNFIVSYISIEFVIFVVNFMQKRAACDMFIWNDELVVGTRHMINASTITIEQKDT